MRRPRTLAMEVMKAGEKAQRTARKVGAAEMVLSNARKAQQKADALYLNLVRQVVNQAPAGQEGPARTDRVTISGARAADQHRLSACPSHVPIGGTRNEH